MFLLDSKAVTKIQAVALTVIIVAAGLSGVAAYYLFSQPAASGETVKIGVFADLDGIGKFAWQGVLLAAEQVNAEGGILGRQVEVIGEDNDVESGADPMTIRSALIRLLTYHKVDFIIGMTPGVADTIAEHKKIAFATGVNDIEEQVLDDYDKYKYLFNLAPNTTSMAQGTIDALQILSENTDFKKVAYLFGMGARPKEIMDKLDAALPELYDYEIVYRGTYPLDTIDFSSYFATAEAAGAEILIPFSGGFEGRAIVNEYYDRQSPMIIYSGFLGSASVPDAWEWTEGKCEDLCVTTNPLCVGYPFTSKTLPAREAYIERWESTPGMLDTVAYDIMRFILPDAIERAGTVEADAVVEALEQTNVETTSARSFAFSSSHGVMYEENPSEPDACGMIDMVFQWQNGSMVPVYPGWVMEEAGVTLTFPDWSGPWD